jgi:hypothetical protein
MSGIWSFYDLPSDESRVSLILQEKQGLYQMPFILVFHSNLTDIEARDMDIEVNENGVLIE